MNTRWKRTLALLCVGALMAGSAMAASVVTTRSIQAQFMGIQTVVNGQSVALKGAGDKTVEPFIYNGDTYVPVRAIGEALDKTVEWDNRTKTLYIGKSPVAEDADRLVRSLEDSHPAFALDAVPQGYAAAREAFLATATRENCSLLEFTLAAMTYTASLQDGHTGVDPFGGTPQLMADVQWVADGAHLYLLNSEGGMTGDEVVAVGGLDVKALFAFLDPLLPAENTVAQARNRTQWSRYASMIQLAGGTFTEDGAVMLTVRGEDGERQQKISLSYPQREDVAVITTKPMGDVLYVDFNQCVPGLEMDQAVEQLEQAVKNGTKKVIIDVRGNGGGDSSTCTALLKALGMELPTYGMYLRYSPAAQEERGYEAHTGSYVFERRPETAQPNAGIRLVVLTDEDTYSSATMLGVFVQDGKLGTVIGRPSANSPSHYGDLLSFTLPNMGTPCTVSHKQWLRPDADADQNTLVPDVVTTLGEDILQVALDNLK